MATLRIYNDIQTEDEKVFYSWCGAEGVCYKDIDDFCQSIPDDDDTIDLRLFCNGGSVQEGWAMYDRLRATGKTISATVEGKAASMATVLLMAAPKERRHAYENASLCVHNPFVCTYAALGETATADELRKMSEQLQAEQDKILDLYVDRCGCDRDEMQTLMNEDKYINTDKAIEMGLIADVLPPLSASKKTQHINPKENVMKENQETKVEVSRSWLDRVLAFFGKKTVAEVTFGMDLNTADGQVLTVEREEGEPQVGDKATPDGTFEMPDGNTIVVENGVITDIHPTDGDGGEDGGDDKKGEHVDEKVQQIAQLMKQVADLTAERDSLTAERDTAIANAKTADDLRILNAVAMAGGEKVLAQFKSNYTPDKRTVDGKKAADTVDTKQTTAAILERLAAVRKVRKK